MAPPLDDKPGVAASDLIREQLERAASREDMARRDTRAGELRLNHALETLDRASQAARDVNWDEKSSTVVNVEVGKREAETDPNSESPTVKPPLPVRVILSWFPRQWRPIAGLLLLGFALYYADRIPIVREWLGWDKPEPREHHPRERRHHAEPEGNDVAGEPAPE